MFKKSEGWLLVLFTLLLLLVRLPAFVMPLDPDSGANAFFGRQMLRGEILYGKFHPAHQLPGIYYTFELAFKLFGDDPNAPKLLLIPWALASTWLIYLIGRSFYDELTGVLSAVFFILVASQRWVAGLTVEMEHFANLPLLATSFLLFIFIRKSSPAWQFIWLGLLGAIAILYKVIFVAPLIVVGLTMLGMVWLKRKQTSVWKALFWQSLWLTIGLILPLIMTAGYFVALGLWERFLLIFKFGSTYFNDPQLMGAAWLPRPFGFPLFWMSINNLTALIFGLMGAYRLVRRSIPLINTTNLTDLALAFWLIISLALAGLRGGGFEHYVIPVIPPLVLTAAFEISSGYQRWLASSSKTLAVFGVVCMTSLIIVNFIWSNFSTYRYYADYELGRSPYNDFLNKIDRAGYTSQKIVQYLQNHTSRNDLIYVWSLYVDIYYYADRLPPVDILWPSYVSATGSPERVFNHGTKYIILDTPQRLARPTWLMDGLAANYLLETKIDSWEIYRRKAP